ncbi:hypothetical protein FBZ83_11991 [Azospirillum brasilense]|uniref:Uncharacterized protein n=1 Tax=Azospirillum brasilense TaxID=192 RepID=A0A560BUZ1_AZOBR|nr:hypothetical protein [Azospirillum brasilense]TWA76440.1 hypothetical protein FBZ83_11991 [Azospirillum brasilense]
MKNLFAHLMGDTKPAAATPTAPTASPGVSAPEKPAAAAPAGETSQAPGNGAAAPQASADDAAARARQDERARCAAIFADPAAAGRVAMAATLAFTTDLSAEQAVAVLKTAPAASAPAAPAGNPFATAMGALGNPSVGTDTSGGDGDDPQALVAQILKAGA